MFWRYLLHTASCSSYGTFSSSNVGQHMFFCIAKSISSSQCTKSTHSISNTLLTTSLASAFGTLQQIANCSAMMWIPFVYLRRIFKITHHRVQSTTLSSFWQSRIENNSKKLPKGNECLCPFARLPQRYDVRPRQPILSPKYLPKGLHLLYEATLL